MTTQPSSQSFTRSFLRIFLPSALQILFFNLISILDVLMLGQLGDVPVATVGLAGQFYFLLSLTLFGTTGGASVFAAQYWGAGDRANLQRVLGLCLVICLAAGGGFAITAVAFPGQVMGLFTHDQAVIEQGVSYLRIIGWSYGFSAVTVAFASIVRSTGNTRLPMLVSVGMMSLNTVLNYTLIFGKLGLPALGVRGAALGTATCRILESVLLLAILYIRHSPVAASPRRLFQLDLPFVSRHIRLILVVFLNEFLWALGVNLYNAMFARLGTSAYAAYNITNTLQGLGLFFSMGCATACGILVGHLIGAGKGDEAFQAARRILIISVSGSLILGSLLIAGRFTLMDFYRVSDTARADASAMLLVAGLLLWLRSLDAMFIVGILRSGGDTRYSALLDVGAIWLAGIPAVALAAFVFHLPVPWVYLAVFAENLVKNILGIRRFLSRNWIHNLTQPPPLAGEPVVGGVQ